MKLPKIAQKGPYIVKVEPKRYSWCTCGLSQTQPFCDTAHRGTEWRSLKIEFEKEEEVHFCGCKQTKNPPFCDDSHLNLK